MAANFTVDQEVLDAVVAHLQEKGFSASMRKLGGTMLMIEVTQSDHVAHVDPLLFLALSKEDALKMADAALTGFGEQNEQS